MIRAGFSLFLNASSSVDNTFLSLGSINSVGKTVFCRLQNRNALPEDFLGSDLVIDKHDDTTDMSRHLSLALDPVKIESRLSSTLSGTQCVSQTQ